jgi:hypothetical protein
MGIFGAILLLSAAVFVAQQPAQPPTPLIQENARVKVSEHVYVIPDGIVAVCRTSESLSGAKRLS